MSFEISIIEKVLKNKTCTKTKLKLMGVNRIVCIQTMVNNLLLNSNNLLLNYSCIILYK